MKFTSLAVLSFWINEFNCSPSYHVPPHPPRVVKRTCTGCGQMKEAGWFFNVLPLKTTVSFCDSTEALACMRNEGVPDDRRQICSLTAAEKWCRVSAKVVKEGTEFILTHIIITTTTILLHSWMCDYLLCFGIL